MKEKLIEKQIRIEALTTAARKVYEKLSIGEIISNKKLIAICRESEIELIKRDEETHTIHEIFETGVNLFLAKQFDASAFTVKAEKTLEFLEDWTRDFPPQSWRGSEQINLQQFSTPPPIAFLMAKIINVKPSEVALEPSAGTGDLAVWLKIAKSKSIIVNEISRSRQEFLKIQGYQPFGVNAEFLNDVLPVEIEPDVCLMNPPFSTSAGRTLQKGSNFGFRHISSALQKLKEGGRLVGLLGTEAAFRTDKGKKFWYEIAEEYDIRAIINLPRKAYQKYGTSIQTSIFAIQKKRTEMSNIQKFDCENLRQILNLSEQIFQS